jgi:organic radical activating enzyme
MILFSYLNGNTKVTLYEDGTKERVYSEKPVPEFPESIDVKITNYCDAGCSFCHEKSTIRGSHGDLEKLKEVLAPLPQGVEIAIGGGNPLSHPNLISFLEWLKEKGLVANMTINQKHIKEYQTLILSLIEKSLIRGVGVSYSSSAYLKDIGVILDHTNNLVFHMILGLNKPKDIEELNSFCKEHNKKCKVLLLGYKKFGLGIDYYLKNKKIDDNKYRWYVEIPLYFKSPNLVLSFDNLAIKRLKIRRFFTDKAWDEFYMGDDFVFSMYIDAVTQNFAPSSTSNTRTSFNKTNLFSFFQKKKD